MFIKSMTLTTALATVLAVPSPVMAGQADFPGSQWDTAQEQADVPGNNLKQQRSNNLPGTRWDDSEKKVPGDSWDPRAQTTRTPKSPDGGSGQGEEIPGSGW